MRRRKGIRLREPRIIKLHAKLYRPRAMFPVSRRSVPSWVKYELEADSIVVIDDVRFNEENSKN